MTDLLKKVIWYYDYVLFYIVKYTPVVGWVVQEKFNKEVRRKPRFLASVADIFKNQDMCDNAVRRKPWVLKYVSDQYKTQEMCNQVVSNNPCLLKHVPDDLKTQKNV